MISGKIKLKETGTRVKGIYPCVYIYIYIHTENCMKEGKHKIYLKVSYIYQLLLFLSFLKQISET